MSEETIYCTDCGYAISKNEFFCPHCSGIDEKSPPDMIFVDYIKERYIRHQKEIRRLKEQINAVTTEDAIKLKDVIEEIIKEDVRKKECEMILWYIQSRNK